MNNDHPMREPVGSAVRDHAIHIVKKTSAPLRRDVVDALRKAIVDGRLAPGSRLIERELIEMTGVSRTVIREALRQLESESIIETIPNKGPIVRRLTRAEAVDLYAIRAVLEGLAARSYVAKASDADILALGEALDRTVAAYEAGDPDEILSVKNAFYNTLFAGADSEILSSMIASLHARVWRWRALGLGHPKRTQNRSQESITGLRDLYDALKARDADRAERVARQEVTNAGAEIMRIFAETDTASL
ncbi:MAG: FCD domain-containing protein [Rhodobacteraceae bacterium]|nr:FCD domain-containing protein [Paracoccaceae bacterium]